MKKVAPIISYLALAGTLLPSFLFLTGKTSLAPVHSVMLVSTVVWFISAYFAMEHQVK